MKTQFENMMFGIKIDNLMADVYEHIDKQYALGNKSALLEVQGEGAEELAEAAVDKLLANSNIQQACAFQQGNGSVMISCFWE